MLSDVLAGTSMGLQFNVVAATVTAVLAAAVAGYPGAPRSRTWWAVGILLLGWALGDGIVLAGLSGDRAAGYLSTWAVVGFAVGYLAPALVGGAVGRAVFRGTGWLSAGAVAFAVAPAISVISLQVSPTLWALTQ